MEGKNDNTEFDNEAARYNGGRFGVKRILAKAGHVPLQIAKQAFLFHIPSE